MKKSVMLMAGILAVALAGSAQAAGNTMFAVQDTTGTIDKAIITDTGDIVTVGTVTAPKVGVGTSNPLSSFHVADTIATAARGIISAQHNDTSAGASIVFRKSRGTEAAPTQLALSDYTGLFQAQYYNGVAYDRAAQFAFRNDGVAGAAGPVTPGTTTMPQAIILYTGASTQAGDPLLLAERFRISSHGNVVTGNLGGTATVDLTTTATNGFLYIPNVAGALTTCATVTAYTGHVPVWFDTTNSKICTCQGTTLKCTAALN